MDTRGLELTSHARGMLKERGITELWLERTLQAPLKEWSEADGTRHFTKPIRERDGHVLHVVVNTDVHPNRIVTVFFDRRLRQRGRP